MNKRHLADWSLVFHAFWHTCLLGPYQVGSSPGYTPGPRWESGEMGGGGTGV